MIPFKSYQTRSVIFLGIDALPQLAEPIYGHNIFACDCGVCVYPLFITHSKNGWTSLCFLRVTQIEIRLSRLLCTQTNTQLCSNGLQLFGGWCSVRQPCLTFIRISWTCLSTTAKNILNVVIFGTECFSTMHFDHERIFFYIHRQHQWLTRNKICGHSKRFILILKKCILTIYSTSTNVKWWISNGTNSDPWLEVCDFKAI